MKKKEIDIWTPHCDDYVSCLDINFKILQYEKDHGKFTAVDLDPMLGNLQTAAILVWSGIWKARLFVGIVGVNSVEVRNRFKLNSLLKFFVGTGKKSETIQQQRTLLSPVCDSESISSQNR